MAYDHEAGFSAVAFDHAMHPRHLGPPKRWNGRARITGPCGDTMEFWVTVREDCVKHVSFNTDGCGSSLACGSMAATLCQGRQISEAMEIRQADILQALRGIPAESEHCALLAATTVRAACENAGT